MNQLQTDKVPIIVFSRSIIWSTMESNPGHLSSTDASTSQTSYQQFLGLYSKSCFLVCPLIGSYDTHGMNRSDEIK